MQQIGKHLNSVLRNALSKDHPILSEMLISWHLIVGAKFALSTTPIKYLTTTQKKQKINILHISAINSGIGMEMSYNQEMILERIAVYFGYKAVDKIRIKIICH